MRHVFLLTFFMLTASIFSCKESTNQNQAKVVFPKEMQRLIQGGTVQLIDVRTPKEFNEGHLYNAQNIDFLSPSFSTAINKLDKQKPIFVYCHSGNRSGKSVNVFLKAGFTEIYDLEGGIVKWKSGGFKLEN